MKKTVFYLSGNPFQQGGGQVVVSNVLRCLYVAETPPVVVAPKHADIPKSVTQNACVLQYHMPSNRILVELFDQLIAPLILLRLRATRVICLNSIVPLLFPGRVDLFFQMRMFHFSELDSLSKKIKNILGSLSARRSENIYCASRDHAEDLRKYLSLPCSKVKVIHLGFDDSVLPPPEKYVRGLRLLFVSVIRPYKNLHGLIGAVLRAKELRPDLPIALDVIGEPGSYPRIDTYMSELYALIDKSEWGSVIQFLGGKSHTDAIIHMCEAKALVFPTLFEGFGLPLLEAMATKTPVICSGVNSLPEIGGDTVEYFNPYDSSSLIDQILKIYETGYSAALIQAAGLRSMAFNWEYTTKALLNNDEFIVAPVV